MKIAAVSYLNTVPLIYGIEHAAGLRAELLLSPPAGCAETFKSGGVDFALVPVGSLDTLADFNVVTDYCIGASGPVRTVVLMSNKDLAEIKTIFLDPHSRTSAQLVRILCRHRWNITPEFVSGEADAFLFIGDKVFAQEGKFKNVWDLAVEWREMTGLPMVFAVWIARQKVPPSATRELEAALGYGVRHTREAIEHYGHGDKKYAYEYLTENIDYRFDEEKKEALTLFQKLCAHCAFFTRSLPSESSCLQPGTKLFM